MRISRVDIAGQPPRSLCWQGDSLVDWVAGGATYDLSGGFERGRVNYAYAFDMAIATRDGAHAAIVESRGTKGLLLERGRIVRELNRSFYCAHAYIYPICFIERVGQPALLAHCPEEYNRLEIEVVATGERLTAGENRRPADYFHSRLSANLAGTKLLSAGWVWHPWDAIRWFDVATALRDPSHLDAFSWDPAHAGKVEESSACWLSDGTVAVGGGTEEDDEPVRNAAGLPPNGVSLFSTSDGHYLAGTRLNHPTGPLLPLNDRYVLTFWRHPRLYDISGGSLVSEWPDLDTGEWHSSIGQRGKNLPVLAMDAAGARYAIGTKSGATVVSIEHL